uniref:KIF-binding protein n=1 Tax=Hucho hucho TaxID=62062 RepID=A0A4W5RAC1_9TELE
MASTYSHEWRSVCDMFCNAQDLSEVESRKDPENDPFRSKERYTSVNAEADQRPTDQPVDQGNEESFGRSHCGDSTDRPRAAKLGVVEYYLRVNHVETEELSAGEEHLMNCMTLLEKCSISPENVSLFIQVRVMAAKTYVSQGFLETEKFSPLHHEKGFEMAYTHTLYYLAQMYKNLELYEKAGGYCHSTLQRQLEFNQFIPLEWAINAATLSQYYISEGRHCLSAAIVIAGLAGEVPSEATEERRNCQVLDKILS